MYFCTMKLRTLKLFVFSSGFDSDFGYGFVYVFYYDLT